MSPIAIFFSVFGVILVAELPDKTALAALVLATRHRPLPVFLGAALALTVQSVVAVTAGHLLSLLPSRPVHVAAGLLFVVSAIVMWRRKGDAEGEAPEAAPSFGRAFATSFAVIFVAEWGDLTQLGTAALAARYKTLLVVFAGATAALWVVAALAVFAGHRTKRLLHPERTKKLAAAVFLVVGVVLASGLA